MFIFFLGVLPFLNIEYGQNERYTTETVCQFNSSETAQQNFLKLLVMKDIMCRCTFPQEILIQLFDLFKEQFISLLNLGQNYFELLVFCPMLGIAIHCIQLEREVCERHAHSPFRKSDLTNPFVLNT